MRVFRVVTGRSIKRGLHKCCTMMNIMPEMSCCPSAGSVVVKTELEAIIFRRHVNHFHIYARRS
jgi:hypothetical protein